MTLKRQIEDLIENGRHFCIYPWIHLHVTGLGNMSPCSLSYSQGYGCLNTNTFGELWQSPSIREFRLKMLNDEMVPDCSACYDLESNGITSLRQDSNTRFSKYIDWVANTDADGYAPDSKPVSWDIRFSNICNLKCRTCCSINSSSWQKDEKALFNKNMYLQSGAFAKQMTPHFAIGLEDSKKLLTDLDEYFKFADNVYCAGGEPLLIDESLEILKKLDLAGNHDLNLIFNTNLTHLNKNINYLNYWKKFKNLKIIVSLDGGYVKGEYIRKGIDFDLILKNLKLLNHECPHAKVVINFTVSAFNILHIPDFHRELIEKEYIKADQIELNILFDPEIYSSKILPNDLKRLAATRIYEHIDWLKGLPLFNKSENDLYFSDFIKQWYTCINYMNSEDWTHLIPEFLEYTNYLDELRSENFSDVFPELESIVNYR